MQATHQCGALIRFTMFWILSGRRLYLGSLLETTLDLVGAYTSHADLVFIEMVSVMAGLTYQPSLTWHTREMLSRQLLHGLLKVSANHIDTKMHAKSWTLSLIITGM